MPWCTQCDRFLSPSTVTPAGECPRCGATVDPGRAHAPDPATAEVPGAPGAPAAAVAPVAPVVPAGPPGSGEPGVADDEETTIPLPWHFKLLVAAIALYLGWRAFQGVEWVVHRF